MQKKIYTRITGGSLAVLITFGVFSYLTFIPAQTFAEVVSPETRTMDDIHYMQEMNTNICATAKSEQQYQLIDYRDGKKYWVARLKDDNCWMTQNLDYDIEPELSEVTSDVKGDNVKTSISGPTAISDWPGSGNDFKGYADPGDYIYVNSTYDQVTSGYCNGVTSFDGSTNCQNLFKKMGEIIGDVDMHYHVGNYYSWSAVTVGSGDSLGTAGQKAEQSICPRGWKLPLSYSTNNSTPGSFYNLLGKYGVNSSVNGTGPNSVYSIYKTPLYFVYGGDLLSGKLRSAAYHGRYWSSIANSPNGSNAHAYSLYFNDGNVVPSDDKDRYLGFSIRCVNDSEAEFSEDLTPRASGNAIISVTVNPVISIDATGMTEDVTFTTVAEGTITAIVSANRPYKIAIGTDQSALERDPVVEHQNIPMITTRQDIKAGSITNASAWGIKKKLSALTSGNPNDTDDDTLYSPVGTLAQPATFFISNGAENRTITFSVGIAVQPNLPSGLYATEVTVTGITE